VSIVKKESTWPLDLVWPEDRVERAFRDMFRNFWPAEGFAERRLESRTDLMRIEEFVENDTCVIRAELPGIDPEKDVEITVRDGILHLHAERQARKEEERPHGYRSEFQYGLLDRSIRLPEAATEADVSATYKDGILEVRVPAPKAVEKPAARIPIQRD